MIDELLRKLPMLKEPSSDVREASFDSLKEIFSNQTLTSDQKSEVLAILQSKDYLFWGIENGETHKSVGRSFSLLALCLLLENDKEEAIDTNSLIEVLCKYIEEEKDFRGQSLDLGWIHCWAHLGDLLAFLGYHPNSSDDFLKTLVMTLFEKLSMEKEKTFIDAEEERLAYGVEYILKKLGDRNEVFSFSKSLNQSDLLTGVLEVLFIKSSS